MNHGPLIPPKLFNFSLIKLNGRDFSSEKCAHCKMPSTGGESFRGPQSRKMGARQGLQFVRISFPRLSGSTNQPTNQPTSRSKLEMDGAEKVEQIMKFTKQRHTCRSYQRTSQIDIRTEDCLADSVGKIILRR